MKKIMTIFVLFFAFVSVTHAQNEPLTYTQCIVLYEQVSGQSPDVAKMECNARGLFAPTPAPTPIPIPEPTPKPVTVPAPIKKIPQIIPQTIPKSDVSTDNQQKNVEVAPKTPETSVPVENNDFYFRFIAGFLTGVILTTGTILLFKKNYK